MRLVWDWERSGITQPGQGHVWSRLCLGLCSYFSLSSNMIVVGLLSSPVIVTKGPLMLIFYEIACVPQNTKTRLIFHVKDCVSLSLAV